MKEAEFKTDSVVFLLPVGLKCMFWDRATKADKIVYLIRNSEGEILTEGSSQEECLRNLKLPPYA